MHTLPRSVPQELQAEKLELWEQKSLGAVESQDLNDKHVKEPFFNLPLTKLHSWIPIYKQCIWYTLPLPSSFCDKQVSKAMSNISSSDMECWGDCMIQGAGMKVYQACDMLYDQSAQLKFKISVV